jgi:EmrB/QacA subfamily drug resistance transporter
MRKWHGNQWAILLTLSLGFFMTLLDLTIVNIAMPSMIDQLHASLDEILWVINAYVLILAVLLITAGRLGDVRGQRNIFIFGVATFTVASLLCGISQNAAELIAARCVQGLGAAMLMPQTMAIIVATFPPQRRGTALGIWGAVAGVATIAGPTLGGFLVSTFDWRWIFFVNLPIGVIVLIAAFTVIPSVKQERQHRLDLGGVLIATAALFCLSFALTEGQR